VNGTPSFFINGERHEATYAFEDLAAAIELHLHAKVPLSRPARRSAKRFSDGHPRRGRPAL
jgi:hypothetical protein